MSTPEAEIQSSLLKIVNDWIAGTLTIQEVAKALLSLTFELGLPAMFLLDHLTERGKQDAETAADIAEWAKLHRIEMDQWAEALVKAVQEPP